MPSPFPGMDPYLEGELWSPFHHELTLAAKHQLAPKLEPRYYPFTERYFLAEAWDGLEIAQGSLYPDVGIAKQPIEGPSAAQSAVLQAPVELKIPMRRQVPHLRIEIRDVEKRKLVTVLEFLSPANKNNPGRRQYLRKRARIIHSPVHLVEFDLLCRGQRLPMKGELPEGDYFIFVSRADHRPPTGVWPIAFGQPLPPIPIPLLPGDADVVLDLQQAVRDAYDAGRFQSIIDYRQPPEVPMSAKEESWLKQVLESAGRR
jgi:Protein of unknown function (DUF4058)